MRLDVRVGDGEQLMVDDDNDGALAVLSPDGAAASFLLDPIVAGAAARTPEVTRSARGPGWVDIRPRVVDGHVADRAGAWYLSGHRRLTGPGA